MAGTTKSTGMMDYHLESINDGWMERQAGVLSILKVETWIIFQGNYTD